MSVILFWKANWITAIVYLLLVVCVWLPYSPATGLHSETLFTVDSDWASEWWDGFLSPSIQMRPHTGNFYHLGYLASNWLGVPGSYFGYQLVYALLLWFRGMLLYLVIRRFFPESWWFCYLCGATAVVHAADFHFLWIGQMNQLGFVFWMLLGYLLLMESLRQERAWAVPLLAIGSCTCLYFSLWSYEAQLPLVILAPLFLNWMSGARWRRRLPLLAGWYAVIALYLRESIIGYSMGAAGSYQRNLLVGWSTVDVLTAYAKLGITSLSFWDWGRVGSERVPWQGLVIPSAVGVLVVLGGARLAAGSGWRDKLNMGEVRRRKVAGALAAGLAALAVSFSLLGLVTGVAEGRNRVFLFPGVAAALVLSSLVGLIARSPVLRRPVVLSILLTGSIVAGGVSAGVRHGATYYHMWEEHRAVMERLLATVPGVQPETLLIMTNVPAAGDPFGFKKYWFDFAARLAYPGTPVAGVYIYADGTMPDDVELWLEGTRWKSSSSAPPSLFPEAEVSNSLLVEYREAGRHRVLEEIPNQFHPGAEAKREYRPWSRIHPIISPIAENRFHPGQPSWSLFPLEPARKR